MRPPSSIRFLICGKRTGSTMLSRILNSHSQIACPFEFAVPSLLGAGHWKYNAASKKAALIAKHYGLSPRLVNAPRFIPDRFAGPLIRRRLDKFCRQVCQSEHKEQFVIKEPAHHEITDRIVRLYGYKSLFLLSRGPLATASSLLKSFDDKDPLKTWAAAHAKILTLSRAGVFLMRYEDLILQPEVESQRLCKHLGVEFEAEMLDFGAHDHADDRMTLWYKNTSGRELVPASKSELHQTVAKGFIDEQHNLKRLREVPVEIIEAYRSNTHGAREIAEALRYDELGILEDATARSLQH